MKFYKKKILNSLSLLCIFSIVLMVTLIMKKSRIERNTYMVFGEKKYMEEHIQYVLDHANQKLFKQTDDTFVTSNSNSSILLKMLQENVSKKINHKMVPIADVITCSNYISIFLGNSDFTDKIRYNNQEKSLKYDIDILNRQIEITTLNVFHIIEEIQSINAVAKIILVGAYLPYYDSNVNQIYELGNIFSKLNHSLKDVCQETQISFVDISLLENKNYYATNSDEINESGLNYLNQKVYRCAMENIC